MHSISEEDVAETPIPRITNDGKPSGGKITVTTNIICLVARWSCRWLMKPDALILVFTC